MAVRGSPRSAGTAKTVTMVFNCPQAAHPGPARPGRRHGAHDLERSKVAQQAAGHHGPDSPIGEIVPVKALEHGEMEWPARPRSPTSRGDWRLRSAAPSWCAAGRRAGPQPPRPPAIADGIIKAPPSAGRAGRGAATRTAWPSGHPGGRGAQGAGLAGAGPWPVRRGVVVARTALASSTSPSPPSMPPVLQAVALPRPACGHGRGPGRGGKTPWQALMKLGAAQPGLRFVVMDGNCCPSTPSSWAVRAPGRRGGPARGIRPTGLTLNLFPYGRHF